MCDDGSIQEDGIGVCIVTGGCSKSYLDELVDFTENLAAAYLAAATLLAAFDGLMVYFSCVEDN